MLNELIIEDAKNSRDDKKQLTLPLSFISEEIMFNYINLVYNTDEEDTNDNILVSNYLNLDVQKCKNLLLAKADNPTILISYQIINDIPIEIDMSSIVFDGENIHLVKKARFNSIQHIEEDMTHRYWNEAILALVILEKLNYSVNRLMIHVIVSNQSAGDEKIHTISKNKHHFTYEHTEVGKLAEEKIKRLWEQIQTGIEPSVCTDTWNNKKCETYCQYASHRLGLCSKGLNNESSDNQPPF